MTPGPDGPSHSPSLLLRSSSRTDYLAAGTRLVWVVDCDSRTVTDYEKLLQPRYLGVDDRLDGRDVVLGFSVAVAEIFSDR